MSTTTALPTFAHATRVNRSLTAALEKRTLLWLAERTPAFVNSDHLTLLGFLAQISAGASFAMTHWDRRFLLLVPISIVLNWLGDSLDGTLARVRRQERPRFGFYADHVVDLFGALALMGGLALSPYVHAVVAMAMLIGFLLLSAESFLATYTLGKFELSHALFGPTEIRILLCCGAAALWHSPNAHLFGYSFLLFDIGGVIASFCMFAMAAWCAAKHTAQLFREEPRA
ncbi:CDP-alcohol phosphatidyltransferase family protein [Granulicella cerasi]|uniref:CDP-alcohol phosphatidyltransferase family protein n=1 Tax=Granulicella cerasi TaxID=741063 RepID=A0ABW1Z6Y3_9BACT|nr:CDP-alcohol phosphatidyltransferase family protein [Granulicella cerasi]